MFKGRTLVIATKHAKEQVIAPILEKELGVNCIVDVKFDTDQLGTFTGEIERILDPIQTVKEKCNRAMELNECDLGIANEGSFGPHPSIFFVPCDEEIVVFIDKKNKIEIVSREISTETNFSGEYLTSENQLINFAKKALFPSHALILRNSKEDNKEIHKGITQEDTLKDLFNSMLLKYGKVYVETDMRAMYNPSRMKVIEKAVEKLILKIQDVCPNCNHPGFDVVSVNKGLPCGLCHLPTNSVLSYTKQCSSCGFESIEMNPNGKTEEDPMYCDYCNP